MTEAVKTTKRTQTMVMTAAFAALIILLAFTPGLGYIPLGFINATTVHIPVILGAIILGPKCGAFLGFMFGLTSLINNSFINPNLTSFVFSPFVSGGGIKSVIICFVPRILIGVVAYFVYVGIKKLLKNKKGSVSVALVIGGIAGSLTNTLLVMNGIFVLFGDQWAAAKGIGDAIYASILGVIVGSGIPEAVVAGIITLAAGQALLALKRTLKF